MSYQKLAMLAAPYSRLELPGWGRLLRRLGVFRDESWSDAPRRTLRGKLHGYQMTLNLDNWSERQTYFLGRFYDLATQLFVIRCLAEGESFVDVGANIGMITLLAARCVGRQGRVFSFEPNPAVFQRLAATVESNGLSSTVRSFNMGLSDAEAELDLRIVTEHTGMGTLAELPPEQRVLVSNTYKVRVTRGDDVLESQLAGPAVVKIDVEGFEGRVLRGMPRVLSRFKPAVVAETVPSLLERAGSSLDEVFGLMRSHGYEAFDLSTRRRMLRHDLRLGKHDEGGAGSENNTVWLHPDGSHWGRMAPYMSHAETTTRRASA